MYVKKKNIIAEKSYDFALQEIQLYKILAEEKEIVLSKQLLRSETSLGVNIHKIVASQSKKDFIHKLSRSEKETRETPYWLNLLTNSKFFITDELVKIKNSCYEIIRTLNSIILSKNKKVFQKIFITLKS